MNGAYHVAAKMPMSQQRNNATLPNHEPKANGNWHLTHAVEVSL
jgi:hypothetical protein